MLEQEYKDLNKEQQQVVDSLEDNLLVVAPAGTGKTKIMSMRVAYLVRSGIKEEEILCLTFTNKAAREMKQRILTYLPDSGNEITIKTFHSFCYYIVCHEKEASHFSFPCTILDEVDSTDIIKRIIEAKGINDEDVYYKNILNFIEQVKRYALKLPLEHRYKWKEIIEAYLKEEDTVYQRDSFIRKHGAFLFRSYIQYTAQNNCIDFMDLVMEATYLLEHPEINERWRNRFKVLQVDEMQDTSIREYELIKRIAGNRQLSLFGDFNQTIYEWRGSKPEHMIEKYKQCFNPKTIHLKYNYRSTSILLEAASAFIRGSKLYPVDCKSGLREVGDKIKLLKSNSQEEECQKIIECIKGSPYKASEIAVLTRTNKYAKYLSDSLLRADIPCTLVEDIKLFRKKEVKELLAFFEYAINERNGNALLKIIRHPFINIPDWLIEELHKSRKDYMFLHDWFKGEGKDPYSSIEEAYNKNQIVILDVESTGLSTTQDEIVQIAAIEYGKLGVTQSLDILVKPKGKVGDSYKVHQFTDEKLQKEGIDAIVALNKLKKFISDKVIVGHNVNYDLCIINSILSRAGEKNIISNKVYDTLDLAYKVYPKLSNHKLETLSQLIATQTEPTHNAMQDILATGEVLTHLLDKISQKKQDRLEKIEAYYSYVKEYKDKVQEIVNYIKTHCLEESLTFLMNGCSFKTYYTQQQIQSIRFVYRIIREMEDTRKSYQDNIIELLAFSALHYSEIEQSDLFKDRISIITVHQAKGLEFNEVYIAGCNQTIFPSYQSIKQKYLVEELRLFYVAMTRAKKSLYCSYRQDKPMSVFLDIIPDEYKIL